MRRTRPEKVLLASLKPGEIGAVAAYLHPDEAPARRLMVLGLLPGEIFLLERRWPDYLIRFGYTRLAMNRKLAGQILVYKMALSLSPGGRLP